MKRIIDLINIIRIVLTKKNYAVFAYDKQVEGNTGAEAIIKDDKDKVFLSVISNFTNTL